MNIDILNIFLEGTVLGFSLAFLFGFGPAFFALIQTGIYRGFWPAAMLAFGIILNDASIISLIILGSNKLLGNVESYKIIGVVGGILIIIFGVVTFMRGREVNDKKTDLIVSNPHFIVYFSKGFLLNLVNPFVWLFWLGVVVGITARFSANIHNVFIFFAGTLSVVFITDLFKSFLAARLKPYVTDKFLIIINKIAGLALVGFGIFLIIRSLLVL